MSRKPSVETQAVFFALNGYMNRTLTRVYVSRSGKAEISRRGYRAHFILDFRPEYPKSFCCADAASEMAFASLNGLIPVGDAGCYASALPVDSDDQKPASVWMRRLPGYAKP
ncbi:MAG: hypothetical protein ACRER7_00705 [Gammaproteobacteria bacterium]